MDKMFIRVYNFELDENGKPKKVEYDYSKYPQEQTRVQRENALLDIELAILRNKQVAEALLNPGTFDPIKKESRVDQILGERANNGRSLFNIWQEEHGIDYADIDKTIDSINNSSLNEIKKFVDRFAEKRSLLSLDTFIYNHQQNMSGAGLIGMYANNTTGQAKMQTTNLSIVDKYTFTIEGRKIKSLHDVSFKKNGIDKRISKICAYFSAASVDNVKDPCLRKLGQNLNTANIAAFMLRAGMDEQEIGLLFNQPYIKYSIDTTGKVPDAKGLKNQFEYLNRRYGTSFGEDEINKLIHQHNFTTKELSRNIVKDSRYKFLQQREVDTLSKNEREDFVKSTMLALALFDNIRMLADQLKGSVQISRADSPNGALSTELHKANKQVKAVDAYMNNKDVAGWGIENITDIMSNKVISTKDSRETMRKKLLSSDVKVPRLQAFYSLGIELAIDLIAPYFMSQSSACQSIVEEIENNVYRKLNDDALKTLYEDFTTYVLSGTEEFGDSDEGSFENKRDYYLYQYPRKLDEILKKNPTLAKTPALAMLRVTSGEIVAERSGRLTPTVRDAATQSFDSLLFGSDREGINVARDLFRYAYYNEGFNFRHNSYGQFFSANFLSSFEETVLSALRTTPDARIMKNFFEQWAAQKNNKVFFKTISEGADVTNAGDNEIIIGLKSVKYNDKIKTAEGKATPWNYIVYKDELYAFSGAEELGVRYSKVSEIDAGPTGLHKFNQKKTAEEVAAAKVDQDKIESLKEFNTASVKQQKAVRRSELDNLINTAEDTADEERFAEELEQQESFLLDDSDFIMEWTDREDYLAFAEQAQQEEYDESLGQITLVENGGKPLC